MLISVNRDITPPSTPSAVTAVAQSSSTILVTWAAAVDTVSGVAQYVIYRSTDNITYSTIATLSGASLAVSYTDTGLTASTLYYYKVQAIDASGNSSAISASGSATTQAASLSGITTLNLTNGGVGKPWTFGHAFKKGDIPTNSYIAGAGPTSFQADIRNRWADGSVRFAVLSGIGGTNVVLSATSTPPSSSSSNVAEPSAAAVSGYSITFTGNGAGTYGIPVGAQSTWARGTASKVRQILGPVMSEFHYYQPTSDDYLALWFYVRAYSNGSIEVETVCENAWVDVPNPGTRTYTVAVNINGTLVPFSGTTGAQTVTHLHHTRWGRIDWLGTDPLITPQHNVKYLMNSRSSFCYDVDRFPFPAASNNILPAQTRDQGFRPVPFSVSNVGTGYDPWGGPGMGGGGYTFYIGPMPLWDVVYLTSNCSPEAYYSVLKAGRSTGIFGLHYRSEFTGRPPMSTESDWYQVSLRNGASGSPGATFQAASENMPRVTPVITGNNPPRYSISHSPPHYFAYVITGRWSYLENAANELTSHQLCIGGQYGWPGLIVTQQPIKLRRIDTKHNTHMSRSAGWSMRNWATAATFWPNTLNSQTLPAADAAVKTYMQDVVAFQTNWLHDTYVLGVGQYTEPLTTTTSANGLARRKHPLGIYNDNTNNPYPQVFAWPPYSQDAMFMNYIINYCFAFTHFIEPDVSTTAKNQLAALLDYAMILPSGIFGGNEYNWRYGQIYIAPWSKNLATFTSFTELWTEIKAYYANTPLAVTDDARDEGLFMYTSGNIEAFGIIGRNPDGLCFGGGGWHSFQMQWPLAAMIKMTGSAAGDLAWRRFTTSATFLSAKEQEAIKVNPLFGAVIPWTT